MPLKIGNKVLLDEMYSMVWAMRGGSKGCRIVVPTRAAATPPYVVMLSTSHLEWSNCVDYARCLVFGVNH